MMYMVLYNDTLQGQVESIQKNATQDTHEDISINNVLSGG